MPRAKHNTKSPRATKRKRNPPRVKPPKNTKLIVPKKVRKVRASKINPFKKTQLDDARQKLKALIENGLYKPRGKRLTKYRIDKINKTFNRVQSHGTIRGAKLIRPFKLTRKGWRLNTGFRTVNVKNASKIPGSIKTHKGAILNRNLAKDIRVLKDGTVKYRTKRFGKMTTIYSGTLNAKQALKWLQQVQDGTFKMPKGKWGRIILFGADTQNGAKIFDSPESLLDLMVRGYGSKMAGLKSRIASLHQRYPNFGPITLEFFNAP